LEFPHEIKSTLISNTLSIYLLAVIFGVIRHLNDNEDVSAKRGSSQIFLILRKITKTMLMENALNLAATRGGQALIRGNADSI
jgi:hypothetical protein